MSGNIGCTVLLSGLLLAEAFGAQAPGNLVFCRRKRGEAGTYVANAEGRNLKRILFFCGPETSPRFSPDSKSILFNVVKAGKASVWIADREGQNRTQICEGDQAAWSPDGSKIFLRRGGQIIERALASGEERTLSPPGWITCAFPDCSPDGAKLLLVAEVEGRVRLWVLTPGRGEPKAIAELNAASPARWSPDGRRIAYSDGIHIFVTTADGSWKYRVSSAGGVERDPAWSPDGTMLVYRHAPTVEGRWVLGVAQADGTKNRLLPSDEDVVSFFAPDWRAGGVKVVESAAGLRPSPRLLVWDIGATSGIRHEAPEEFFKQRERWKRAPGVAAIAGGVAIESDRTTLVIDPKTSPVVLCPKSPDKERFLVELFPVHENGEEAARVEWLKLISNDGEEAAVEVCSATAAGARVRTLWSLSGARPLVSVSAVGDARALRIRVPMKYVIVPDRFANDLLCDPTRHTRTRVVLPWSAAVLGLAGSGDVLLEMACPREGQTVDLLKRGGRGDEWSEAEVRLADAPLAIGVLTGPGLWHEERLAAKYDRKRIDLNWEMPTRGEWRLAVRVQRKTYSDMFTDRESPRFDGKKLFLTAQEEFAGLVDLAVVYLYGPSPGTPLDRLTPTDLALDGMGMRSFLRALDIDGLHSYRTAPRLTTWADVFATLESIRHLYDRGVEKEERVSVERLCDDVPALLEGMDSRLDEFAAMARRAKELADRPENATPEAQTFFVEIKPTLGRLEDACQKRSKLAPAAELAARAAEISQLASKDLKDVSEKRKRFSELSGRLFRAARARADLIHAMRGLARDLRDLAGAGCFERPEMRGVAAQLRQLAQDALRNRYYFEADWRGESHRVAPYWLGGRPY